MQMIEKVVEYMLCYAVAFFLGFLACALCVMFIVYNQIRNAKIKAVNLIRMKHARRDRR
jgi:hypothetical protein